MKKTYLIICYLFFSNVFVLGQTEEWQVGSSLRTLYQSQSAFYDLSDPESINIKVSVWGFVRFPGRYVVPIYSTAVDLLSYAGGPSDAANLEELRIFRLNEDSIDTMIKFNYNDLLWNENLSKVIRAPQLKAGDIFLVPGEPRLYFKDYLSITLSVTSTLISLAILILNIVR